jgi:hypothetical protein
MPTSSTYAFSNDQLTQIITRTADAIGEMNQLNSLVQSHSDMLGSVNRSDSGGILQNHLMTWTQDFHTVVNNLTDLNQKAINLRNVNINASQNSTATANQGGQ